MILTYNGMSEDLSLFHEGAKFVPGDGPQNAKVVFVCEAPGKDENNIGRPLVGATGRKVFNPLLSMANIVRNRCYITNVLKRRPPNNKHEGIIKLAKIHHKETDTYKAHLAYLKKELEALNPNIIVAMGNLSLYALTGNVGIKKWRGSILESTLLPGVKVLPMLHPTTVFHDSINEVSLALDMQKLKVEQKFPEIKRADRVARIQPTYAEAMQYMSEIHAMPIEHAVAFDIETRFQELACFGFSKTPYDAMCIPLLFSKGNYFSPEEETNILSLMAKILQSGRPIITQNGGNFDMPFLFRKYGIIIARLEDTMIAHKILVPELPMGLDYMTSLYTDLPYYKEEGKIWKDKNVTYEDHWLYNCRDCFATHEVWDHIKLDLKKQGNWEIYLNQRTLAYPFMYMTETGIRMDIEGMAKASKEADTPLFDLTRQFQALAEENGYPGINLKSSAQLIEYFYDEQFLGYRPIYKNLKTKKPTTDDKALKRMSRKGIKEATLLLQFRQEAKLKSTYYEAPLDRDGRFRSGYVAVGTKNGRPSSKKTIWGTGGNLQNQPYAMKKFMLADPGYIFYNIDLSQAENRLVAYIAPEPVLIKAFNEGIDVHSLTASMIFGIPADEIRQMHKDGVKCEVGTGQQSHRFWGKKANHSFNYGETAYTFSLYNELPIKDATSILNGWLRAYPGIKDYWGWVEAALREDMSLTNLFGRKRTFLRWWNDAVKEAYSYIPQSTVAEITNQNGVNYIWREKERFEGLKLLNLVHDSVMFEIPLEIPLKEHFRMVRDIIDSLEVELTFRGKTFSIPCDLEVGFNLVDTKEVDKLDEEKFIHEVSTLVRKEGY